MIQISSLIVGIVIKPAVVIAMASLLALTFRRLGPAARHAIWSGALVAVFCLPLLDKITPPLRLPRVVNGMASQLTPAFSQPSRVIEAVPVTPIRGPRSPALVPPATASETGTDPLSGEALVFIWAVVALMLAGRRFAAQLAVRRLIARGRAPSAMLSARCEALTRASHISSGVRVIVTDETASPAVAGIARPVIILPASAETWSAAEADSVLTHELCHVARRDCLGNLLADIAVAIYWCNPLVHLAARRIRAEAELACDDQVIRTGTTPDSYASLLLGFARAAYTARLLPRAATAAARPSELESRVMAVLDPRVSRVPLRREMAAGLAALSVVLSLPVAAATLGTVAVNPPVSAVTSRTAGPNAGIIGAAPETGKVVSAPTPRPASPERLEIDHPVPSSPAERLPMVLDQARLDDAARRALSGPDSVLAGRLVAALSHVPMHAYDLIRDRAAWAILQTRGDRLMEPVSEALGSSDWRVQAYAAWTVAVARDRRPVPQLLPLVRHPVWQVRAMAAYALCELGDPRAVDVMVGALSDPAWQVRVEAVEYLASMGDGGHDDSIRARLSDRHVAVRSAAARALNTQ